MSEQQSDQPTTWRSIFTSRSFQSEWFNRWHPLYKRLFYSRWTIIALLIIGIVRGIFFLAAYAPADGADASRYYMYAAYIAGYDLPPQAADVSPLYPLFIYFHHYVLAYFNLILIFQFAMSASLGVIIYWGLRRYNAFFAVLVALVVLADPQIGILFNFTSTEPLYIFLLCVAYMLAIVTGADPDTRWRWQDVLLGMTLVLLRETRTVARYLFVPFGVLFSLYTRNWRRILSLIGGFLLTIIVFQITTQTAQVEQTVTANNVMYARPLFTYDIFNPDAGPASRELANRLDTCDGVGTRCIQEQIGSDAAARLYQRSYQEALAINPNAILEKNIDAFNDFLRLTGQQYRGEETPATVQCRTTEQRITNMIDLFTNRVWRNSDLTPAQQQAVRTISVDFSEPMCPPAYEENTLAKQITDYISFRYRSLSRPHPYRWNAILFALVLLIPWARRFWYPYVLAGSVWIYHAAVSAVVINVQPRYVAVTNPMRAVVVMLMLFLIGHLFLKLVDTIIYRYEK